MRIFLRFIWRCLRLTFTHSWGVVEKLSCFIGLTLPIIARFLPDWFSGEGEKLKDIYLWLIPLSGAAALIIVRLFMSPFWAYREALDAKNKAESILENSRKPKPSLKIELKSFQLAEYHAMGPKAGTTEVTRDGISVAVTNIGPEVSISAIDLFVTKHNGEEIALPAKLPTLSLPQPLKEMNTIAQSFLFNPYGLPELHTRAPRVVVKTSCGYTKKVGTSAFQKMKPIGGHPLLLKPKD